MLQEKQGEVVCPAMKGFQKEGKCQSELLTKAETLTSAEIYSKLSANKVLCLNNLMIDIKNTLEGGTLKTTL